MKLIKQSAEIWEQPQGDLLLGVYQQIERAGRICYKSEDKITEDSAKPFVERMIASKHYAMLEHGTVYLKFSRDDIRDLDKKDGTGHLYYWELDKVLNSPYTKKVYPDEDYNNVYVTTNLRVIVESNPERIDFFKYICAPTKYHAKRATVHCITNRQVTHELVRHRVMSFAQESTRYCNYTKGKFGEELTFIIPCNTKLMEGRAYWHDGICFRMGVTDTNLEGFSVNPNVYEEKEAHHMHTLLACFKNVENNYRFLVSKLGLKPQEAATILPNAIKADIVITGFVDDWKHLFDLRVLGTTGAPHPQMKELMTPVYEEFIKRGYINDSKTEG